MTQKEAARRLGVGHATVERAEEREPGALLGRVLRKALERDAVQTRETLRAAVATQSSVCKQR